MVFKTHKTNTFPTKTNGFTLIELLVVLVVVLVLIGFIVTYLNPIENAKISRDQIRFSDLQLLDSAISQYASVHNVYPDLVNVTRISTVLPIGSGSDIHLATGGWIAADLSAYLTKLPIDPSNGATYYYSYRHDATSFEINANLEVPSSLSQNDGGNDPDKYELGNNLTLL